MSARENDADLVRSGFTTRYHTTPELGFRQQTTAEHAWRMAAILTRYMGEPPSLALLNECLWHDAHETFTGDMPGPFGRRHQFIKTELAPLEQGYRAQMGVPVSTELTPLEFAWLKFADRAEAVNYCVTFAPHLMERPDWADEREEVEVLGQSLGINPLDLCPLLWGRH